MDRVKAVLCSRNRNKARELEHLLPGWSIEPLEATDWPEETGATYLENARGKARFGRDATGGTVHVLGEDSGIEVAALGGRPGIESARYAPEGAPAIEKLLGELEGVADRDARYVCELVCITPAGEEVRGTGTLAGRISPPGRAAARASATTRSSCPTGRSAPSRSSATRGRPRARIVRGPRARCSPRSVRSCSSSPQDAAATTRRRTASSQRSSHTGHERASLGDAFPP